MWALGSQNSTAGKKTMAGAATPPLLRIGVLALLVLQNTSLRLVMKHARTVSPNFSATAAVFAGVWRADAHEGHRPRSDSVRAVDG